MYGLGGGLFADEVGLLLTLGDYQTRLTYTVVVGAVAVAASASILQRYWREIGIELKRITFSERVAYFGLFVLVVPLLIENLAQIQTSTVGILAAFLYRAKFGGRWSLSRKRFLLEMTGFLSLIPIIIIPSLVADYLVGLVFGPLLNQGDPTLSVLPGLIAAGIGTDIVGGLFGGWIWVRILRRAASSTDKTLRSC